MSEQLRKDTLDFIFDIVKDAPEAQLHNAEALDAKIIQVLSVASVVVGLVGFGIQKEVLNQVRHIVPLLVGVVAYILVVCLAIAHLRGASFRRSLHGDQLWTTYWNDDVIGIKHALVTDIAAAYTHNKAMLQKKQATLLWALVFMGIQVASLGIFVALVYLT
jgi:hypothetical protein